ncbi:MAG: type II secretion system F family protein [Gammaproteobacteria bacterium]|jgi:tight adherence protein C
MEYLLQIFGALAGDPGQARWLLAGALGVAAMLFGLGVLYLVLNLTDPLRRRLDRVAGRDRGGHEGQSFANLVEPLSGYVLPKKDKEISAIRSRLIHAGYRAQNALASFYAVKTLVGLGFMALAVLSVTFYPLSTMHALLLVLGAGFVGTMLPNYVLAHSVKIRQRKMLNDFPDALDLLVACTEAGLGLNAALQRVAQEMAVSSPELAEEIALVNAQVRAGADRVDALKDLADRTGLVDIRGLVSMLAQSMRFGVSIAETLRVYAEEFRDKRMQRAEEKAAMIGTKMIFPLVFCMFPAFFVVAVGPAVLGVLNVLKGL